MATTRDRGELLRAARDVKVTHRILPEVEAAEVWARIGQTYFPNERPLAEGRIRWLWDGRLDNAASVFSLNGWQYIGEFVGARPALVLFSPSDDLNIIEFVSGQDLTAALGESFHFEFYVTDTAATYLLCFNHHDYLIGAGTAAQWIQELATRLENGG